MYELFGTKEIQVGNTLYIVKRMPSERATESLNQKVEKFVAKRVMEELKNAGYPDNKANIA